jgi:F420-0:gamma-glutamyl ligase
MKVKTIKTRVFIPPKDDLDAFLKESFSGIELKEKSVVVVSSKIIAISQGRCVKIGDTFEKPDLIKQEADFYIDMDKIAGKLSTLTIKDNILISSSGIDESNANGYYVLWPQHPFGEAKKVHAFLKKMYHLDSIGVIISDSHRIPLRAGIVGMGIAYYGLNPLRDYRGQNDIFGRPLKYSQTNIVDSLAAAAIFEMGEGNETMPIAIIEDARDLQFTDEDFSDHDVLKTDMDHDKYNFFLKSNIWKKGK